MASHWYYEPFVTTVDVTYNNGRGNRLYSVTLTRAEIYGMGRAFGYDPENCPSDVGEEAFRALQATVVAWIITRDDTVVGFGRHRAEDIGADIVAFAIILAGDRKTFDAFTSAWLLDADIKHLKDILTNGRS